METHKLILQV